MAKITRRGVEMNTVGVLPTVGSQAPVLNNLTKKDWVPLNASSAELAGKYRILNIFPSIDTPTCATTVRNFNKMAVQFKNTIVLCISKDLPPALNRFCGAEGITSVIPVSAYRSDCNFGDAYGIRIVDGAGAEQAFKDLFGRALIVLDPNGKVLYSELVGELAKEPNYDACLAVLSGIEKDKVDAKGDTKGDVKAQGEVAMMKASTAVAANMGSGATSTAAASAASSPVIFSGSTAATPPAVATAITADKTTASNSKVIF